MDWTNLKAFIITMLTRWLLKAAGGILIGIGIQGGEVEGFLTQTATVIVGGLFFLIGLVISWFQNKYLASTPPSKLIAK
jgi:preprotein translocase subunit SecG